MKAPSNKPPVGLPPLPLPFIAMKLKSKAQRAQQAALANGKPFLIVTQEPEDAPQPEHEAGVGVFGVASPLRREELRLRAVWGVAEAGRRWGHVTPAALGPQSGVCVCVCVCTPQPGALTYTCFGHAVPHFSPPSPLPYPLCVCGEVDAPSTGCIC